MHPALLQRLLVVVEHTVLRCGLYSQLQLPLPTAEPCSGESDPGLVAS